MTTIRQKVLHVLSAPQSRPHRCHWPGCEQEVAPALWGCRKHWSILPIALRYKIWATYRPGQEDELTPSRRYLEVAREVQEWIAAERARRGR